jgi:hypothetical protein
MQLATLTARLLTGLPLYTRPEKMLRRIQLGVVIVFIFCVVAGARLSTAAANNTEEDAAQEIFARARVLPGIGPGLIALKRDAAGRYYAAGSPGNVVSIFTADGKRAGEIPDASSPDPKKNAKIVFADAMDVDSTGRVFVADRGANAVKIFAPDGSLAVTIPVPGPTSIAALPGDEFVVTSLRYRRLMMIYGDGGTLTRAIGDPGDFSAHFDPNRMPDLGRVSADPAGNIYFVFSFLPVPTVRRFDRFGYAGTEISLDQFAPNAKSRDLLSLDRHDDPPATKPVIDALGVDPVTQEIWIAVGNDLLRFGNLGVPIASYRTLSPAGARLVPKTILIEPNRLLLGTDSFGVFEFAKPAKPPANAVTR